MIFSSDISKRDILFLDMISDEVVSDINTFCSYVMNWILRYGNNTVVIAEDWHIISFFLHDNPLVVALSITFAHNSYRQLHTQL